MISQREQEIREGRKAKKELENKLIERYNKYQFKKDQLKTEQYTKNTLTEELNALSTRYDHLKKEKVNLINMMKNKY